MRWRRSPCELSALLPTSHYGLEPLPNRDVVSVGSCAGPSSSKSHDPADGECYPHRYRQVTSHLSAEQDEIEHALEAEPQTFRWRRLADQKDTVDQVSQSCDERQRARQVIGPDQRAKAG